MPLSIITEVLVNTSQSLLEAINLSASSKKKKIDVQVFDDKNRKFKRKKTSIFLPILIPFGFIIILFTILILKY